MYVKFDEGQKFTRTQLKYQELSDSLDGFNDAGYILPDDELVVDIDCLPIDTIKAMINEFNIKTKVVWTDRGAHLYFKRPMGFRRAKGVTALGFPVEYKHSNNTYAITVKRFGKERIVDNPDVLQQLPNYLQPCVRDSLVGLEDGDGRNNALYAHKRKIHKLGNTQKILHFINKHIFATPMDDKELETLSREENFEEEKDGENYIAELIMKERKMVIHQGVLYFIDGGYYNNDIDDLRRIVYQYCPNEKTRFVDEVIRQILYRTKKIPDNTVCKIKLRNGYLSGGKFIPYNYTGFTPYNIDIEYDPEAESVEKIDSYLELLSNGDPDYRDFILEVIASSLITDPEVKRHLARFFIFVGDGGNGKGTLLEIITRILGHDNVSANSITELGNPVYAATLIGKLANLGDDIIDEPINRKEMKVLKNLSTGDIIQTKRLYENPISVSLIPSLIFTSNHILKSFDKDYSYRRRVLWCPIYNKPEKPEPFFISSVTNEVGLRYWMKLIIEAYERLYENGEYTKSKTIKEFNEKYHRDNNNTLDFVDTMSDEEIDGTQVVRMYENYQTWCDANGEDALTKKQLALTLQSRGFKRTELKRKAINNGRSYRAWKKIKEESKKK